MRAAVSSGDAQEALRVLERNRAQLAAVFAPPEPDRHDKFPRSATFRWITAHLAGRSLVATAAALLLRMAVRRGIRSTALRRVLRSTVLRRALTATLLRRVLTAL